MVIRKAQKVRVSAEEKEWVVKFKYLLVVISVDV